MVSALAQQPTASTSHHTKCLSFGSASLFLAWPRLSLEVSPLIVCLIVVEYLSGCIVLKWWQYWASWKLLSTVNSFKHPQNYKPASMVITFKRFVVYAPVITSSFLKASVRPIQYIGEYSLVVALQHRRILTYNDRTVTHLHIKWGVALGRIVVGGGTRHLPPSRIHAPVTNPL